MKGARERLVEWLEENPDSWLTESFQSIARQTEMSPASVDRHLPEIVADREGILPSEVVKRRQEEGRGTSRRPRADRGKIRQIIAENPNAPVRDLAYLAKCHPRVIERELKTRELSGNDSEIREIQTQITRLQKRLAELSSD